MGTSTVSVLGLDVAHAIRRSFCTVLVPVPLATAFNAKAPCASTNHNQSQKQMALLEPKWLPAPSTGVPVLTATNGMVTAMPMTMTTTTTTPITTTTTCHGNTAVRLSIAFLLANGDGDADGDGEGDGDGDGDDAFFQTHHDNTKYQYLLPGTHVLWYCLASYQY